MSEQFSSAAHRRLAVAMCFMNSSHHHRFDQVCCCCLLYVRSTSGSPIASTCSHAAPFVGLLRPACTPTAANPRLQCPRSLLLQLGAYAKILSPLPHGPLDPCWCPLTETSPNPKRCSLVVMNITVIWAKALAGNELVVDTLSWQGTSQRSPKVVQVKGGLARRRE